MTKKGQVGWIKGLLGGGGGGGSKKPARKKRPDVEIPRPATGKPVSGGEKGTAPGCAAKPPKPGHKDVDEKIDGKVGLMRTKATMWEKWWEEGDCDIGEYPSVVFMSQRL